MKNDLFENASIPKAYFTLALPVVFSMVISLVYNMVDTFFIAQTQNANLVAGVSICAPIFTLMIALGDIFGLGGSSVISRLFGEKKDEEGKHVSGFCLYAAIAGGIVVAIVLLLLQDSVLALLGANSDTKPFASQYFFYLALGAPIILVNYSPSNMLRTEGLAVESMFGTILGAVVNIILDPIFIFGLQMGASGAAIATVLGTLCSDILLVYFVMKKSKKLTVSMKKTKISKENLFGIIAIGIPASITNIMQSFGIALTNRYLVTYGTDKVAAMGIAMKVNMIALLVMVGFSFGGQPLVGYCYGAKKFDRMKKIIRFALVFEVLFSMVICTILILLAPNMIAVFMQDEKIVEAGAQMLRFALLTVPFVSIVLIFTTTFQSMGKAMEALILSISRQGVVLLICMLVLSSVFGYAGVIRAQALSDVITCLIGIVLYLRVRKELNVTAEVRRL